MPAVLVGAILLANRLGASGAVQATSAVAAAPAAPVTVRLEVTQPTVKAGRPVQASVYAVNHTGRSLRVSCTTGTWPVVLLSGGGLPPTVFDPLLQCPAPVLPPGQSHFTVSVPTTYRHCGMYSAGPGPGNPKCGPGFTMPPLPAGVYQLKVASSGLPAGTTWPPPVAITLQG